MMFLLFSISLLLSPGPAAQQQAPPSLPLPEMQRLSKLYVGTWNYTETYANGAKNTGVYTSEPGPGDNSIINRFHSKGPAGESEGVLVMTFDPGEKAYKCYVLGGDFPGVFIEDGHWDGESLVFRGQMSLGAMKVVHRTSTKLLPNGTLVSDSFTSANGAPEKLLLHVEASRK
jgi:hypothetical protein